MKILFVAVSYPPALKCGGSARTAGTLARGLVRAGAEVRVLTTDSFLEPAERPAPEREEHGALVRTLCVPAWLGRRANRYGFAPGFRRALRHETLQPDICLAQGVWTWPLALVPAACRRRRLPFVLIPHGALAQQALSDGAFKKRLYLRLVERRTVRAAAAVLYSSEMERQRSRPVTGGRPAIVVPNALEPSERRTVPPGHLHDHLSLERDRLLVGISGRIHAGKGFDRFVPALTGTDPRVHCVIFGPDDRGYRSVVERLVTDCGVRGRVHFLGHLEGEKLDDVYASLDLLAVPSMGESFGNVVTESLAQGTEVMMSDRVPLADYVVKHGLGTVVGTATAECWASALNRWATGASEFDSGRAARTVRRDFDLDRLGRSCLKQLQSVVDRRKPVAP